MKIIDSVIIGLVLFVGAAVVKDWNTSSRRIKARTEAPCLSPQKYGGNLIAAASENERAAGRALHGDIFLNGTCYHFATGDKTTSAPFGRYSLGSGLSRPYLNTINDRHTAYPMSDAYDPVLKRQRTALFVHPGRHTEGCIGINPAQWEQFERDMALSKPKTLILVPSDQVRIASR